MNMEVQKRLLKKFDDMVVLNMEATIKQAEKAMCKSNHDHLPVFNVKDNVFGILSSFDIIKFLASGGNEKSTKAWEICSFKLVTCSIDMDVEDIVKLMLEERVHHVLLKKGEKVCGIVSTWDLLHHFVKH